MGPAVPAHWVLLWNCLCPLSSPLSMLERSLAIHFLAVSYCSLPNLHFFSRSHCSNVTHSKPIPPTMPLPWLASWEHFSQDYVECPSLTSVSLSLPWLTIYLVQVCPALDHSVLIYTIPYHFKHIPFYSYLNCSLSLNLGKQVSHNMSFLMSNEKFVNLLRANDHDQECDFLHTTDIRNSTQVVVIL